MEGDDEVDLERGVVIKNFYPRPPGGGRRCTNTGSAKPWQFLSTPSGWRATCDTVCVINSAVFLSTPSGWRATTGPQGPVGPQGISIHALRVEGDYPLLSFANEPRHFYPRPPGGGRPFASAASPWRAGFLSTPSGWRATVSSAAFTGEKRISIHALRVEGDTVTHAFTTIRAISIHALRVEGDFNSISAF